MEIRKLTGNDLTDAGKIAYQLWCHESADTPEELHPALYQYLVRYYFHPASEYNYGAFKDGKLCAFLLAAPARMSNGCRDAAAEWIRPYLKTAQFQEIFTGFQTFLDCNAEIEDREAFPDEIVMLLFCSILRGSGQKILQAFDAQCKANGIPGAILWTDESCNVDYYDRHGFKRTADFLCPVSVFGKRSRTWIFRKSFR